MIARMLERFFQDYSVGRRAMNTGSFYKLCEYLLTHPLERRSFHTFLITGIYGDVNYEFGRQRSGKRTR